jgi:hypothetical protein
MCLLRIEGAELAALIADIRVVDMLIAHIVGAIAVQALADDIGQIANRRQIGGFVEANAILIRKSLLRHDFRIDVHQVASDIAFGATVDRRTCLSLQHCHCGTSHPPGTGVVDHGGLVGRFVCFFTTFVFSIPSVPQKCKRVSL